jgi:indolepyruvate ferredoxin oxidoreductase
LRAQRIGRGEADLMLALDLVAALAPEAADTIGTGRTRAIANAEVSATMAFQFDRNFKADPALLLARLRRATGLEHTSAVDGSALALAILGDSIGTNLFMVGIAAQRGLLPVGVAAIERAVALNGVAVPFNLRAFRLGRLYAVDPERVHGLNAAPPVAAIPDTLVAIVAHRVRHLTDYQDDRLAQRYRTLVERVRVAEAMITPGETGLATAAARNYAKLLAYKDEYEVARLLSDPALLTEIGTRFADGARISFNLAPPIFGGKAPDGRPRKREFGRWMLPVLRVLSGMRRLRGTALDPFGYLHERRVERALVDEYERLIERVLADLTPDRHEAAVRLLSLADEIRGYGPVKAAAIETYRANLDNAQHAFDTSHEPSAEMHSHAHGE